MRHRLNILALGLLLAALAAALVALARANARLEKAEAVAESVRARQHVEIRLDDPAAENPGENSAENPADSWGEDPVDHPLAQVSFKNQRLEAAIDALRAEANVNMIVDWRSLAAVGITPATPVSLRLHDTTLGQTLEFLLRVAGGGDVALHYQSIAGVIVIGTRDEFARSVVLRIYDVSDILERNMTRDAALAARTGDPKPLLTLQEQEDALIRLIEGTIEGDSWKDAGGSTGSIYAWSAQLFIDTTPDIQKRVAALLAQVRRGGGKTIVPPPRHPATAKMNP